MLDVQALSLVENIFSLCQKKNLKIRTIESCTGGALAHHFTYFPGSSKFFDHSIVSYSNDSKIELVSVDPRVIKDYGPASFETLLQMVRGGKPRTISIATTGVLGPDTDDHQVPIGLVYIAVALEGICYSKRFHFTGERHEIQMQAVKEAMNMIVFSDYFMI